MTDGRREQILTAAEELTRGMKANDAEVLGSVYSPDALVWHNTDRRDASIGELLDVVRLLQQRSTCSMTVDERFVVTRTISNAQRIILPLGAAGWHLVTLDVPRLLDTTPRRTGVRLVLG